MSQHSTADTYYVPEGSAWPLLMTLGLVVFVYGFGNWLNGDVGIGQIAFAIGLGWVIVMTFVWLRGVVNEAEGGKYNMQVDRTYRWSMAWFIFSEVMFFGAFFGALFYARVLSVPWLAGAGPELMTNEVLWQGFEAV
ncbi:MAG: cytochrome c oxidase subunit 3, partial [Nevskiales bacterium]